jgi:hypothetical protein
MTGPDAENLLAILEENCWDLRCRDVPLWDDVDTEWVVIEHHMSKPREREYLPASTPVRAIRNAIEGRRVDDITSAPEHTPPDQPGASEHTGEQREPDGWVAECPECAKVVWVAGGDEAIVAALRCCRRPTPYQAAYIGTRPPDREAEILAAIDEDIDRLLHRLS